MTSTGLHTPAADLLRAVPKPAAPSASPKPARRFDDVLAAKRDRPQPKPPADKPKAEQPAAKSEAKPGGKTKKSAEGKAASTKKAESQDHEDDSDDSAEATDAAEAPHQPVKPADAAVAKKPAVDKTKKPTTSADAATEDAEAEAHATADHAPTKSAGEDASPLAVQPDADGKTPEKSEGEKKPTDSVDISPDASALAATLAAAPKPTDAPMPTTDANASTAATPAVNATGKPAVTPPAADLGKSAAAPAEGEPAVKPHAAKAGEEAVEDTDIFVPPDADLPDEKPAAKAVAADDTDPAAALQPAGHDKPATHVALPDVQTPAAAPARSVAEENVDHIVTSVRGELLTKGGTMQIRLDPPSLGSINIQIHVDDGVMSASLTTSNDEATRLLSHNLQQLKTTLESAGVTVDRIQVKQAAPAEHASNTPQQGEGERRQSDGATQDQSARQEQQRREMLQRMWAKLSGSGDPLDLVA